MKLLFVTTNDHKVLTANHVCNQFGITVERRNLELEEIQSDFGEAIAKYKATQAFEELKQPVVVSDDCWAIPGLNGFPGPYMKSMNHWFTPNDYLRLTKSLEDRRIFLDNFLCYQDAEQQKVFAARIEGTLLKTSRGQSPYPVFQVISFDGGQHSAAEINSAGYPAMHEHKSAWYPLCEWLNSR